MYYPLPSIVNLQYLKFRRYIESLGYALRVLTGTVRSGGRSFFRSPVIRYGTETLESYLTQIDTFRAHTLNAAIL